MCFAGKLHLLIGCPEASRPIHEFLAARCKTGPGEQLAIYVDMGCSTSARRLHKVTTLNYVTEIHASKGQPSNPRIKPRNQHLEKPGFQTLKYFLHLYIQCLCSLINYCIFNFSSYLIMCQIAAHQDPKPYTFIPTVQQ